jgi:hypothetical protein
VTTVGGVRQGVTHVLTLLPSWKNHRAQTDSRRDEIGFPISIRHMFVPKENSAFMKMVAKVKRLRKIKSCEKY